MPVYEPGETKLSVPVSPLFPQPHQLSAGLRHAVPRLPIVNASVSRFCTFVEDQVQPEPVTASQVGYELRLKSWHVARVERVGAFVGSFVVGEPVGKLVGVFVVGALVVGERVGDFVTGQTS